VARKYLRGKVYWIAAYVDGQEIRFSARTKSAKVAARILAKIETEVAEGRFLDRKAKSVWTLGELSDVYLDRMDELKPRSATWRRDRLQRILERLGRQTPIESIGPAELDGYAVARLRAGKAVSTVRAEANILRHALLQAHRWKAETGLSEYRLRDWVPPSGRAPRQPRFLNEAEVRKLLEVAARRALALPEHRRAHLLLRLALETGARIGELCQIARQDFDSSTGVLRIRALKGGSDRSFTLLQENGRDLARLLRESDEPFAGKSLPKDRYRKFWHHVREKAGMPMLRFHDLRHTFASEFLRRGGWPRVLQDQLGHKTSRMTDRYSHSSPTGTAPAGVNWRAKARTVARTARRRR
jgi:integrase